MNAIDRYLTRKTYDFLDCIQDIVAIIDKDGIIVKTNKAFSRITGVDPRPFFGTKMQTLVDKGVMKQSTALKAKEDELQAVRQRLSELERIVAELAGRK